MPTPHPALRRRSPLAAAHSAAIEEDSLAGLAAVAGCCAHLVCTVQSMTEHHGHYITHACIDHAFVRQEFWCGKTFAPQADDTPSLLTFLGSKQFGHVRRGDNLST